MRPHRVESQLAFVLHSYPFRETSLVVEVFSRDFGRIPLVAKGARRPRSSLRGILQAFQPLEISWSGKGDVPVLTKAEWVGGQPLLIGRQLLFGFYLNELIIHLLPREDANQVLFDSYSVALKDIANSLSEAHLRNFETRLLASIGYGTSLQIDTDGLPIQHDRFYVYEVDRGPVAVRANSIDGCVSGQTLLDMSENNYSRAQTLFESKVLMRRLIAHYLEGKIPETRKIFFDLQEL